MLLQCFYVQSNIILFLVMSGIPTGNPYMIPGQAQIYPQGPPPTYDQALTHPAAIVGQHVRHVKI